MRRGVYLLKVEQSPEGQLRIELKDSQRVRYFHDWPSLIRHLERVSQIPPAPRSPGSSGLC
ncbi:hypothetical protein [Meiothermus rufus]|uniref:hypothetical protein n=1 Tax=Meiothermus rufus TaxID=604332 RepID=UPI00041160FE|nr:hypothetical protein [Meiothermus rufus]